MSLEGTVHNGVIVLESEQSLPEGTRVEIVVKDEPVAVTHSTFSELVLRFAGVVKDLPEDMALNHDHYLHGAPKK